MCTGLIHEYCCRQASMLYYLLGAKGGMKSCSFCNSAAVFDQAIIPVKFQIWVVLTWHQ